VQVAVLAQPVQVDALELPADQVISKLRNITNKELSMKWILILAILAITSGCSHLHLVKECKKVENEDLWACRKIKPWE
jgi:hypothetical protein